MRDNDHFVISLLSQKIALRQTNSNQYQSTHMNIIRYSANSTKRNTFYSSQKIQIFNIVFERNRQQGKKLKKKYRDYNCAILKKDFLTKK